MQSLRIQNSEFRSAQIASMRNQSEFQYSESAIQTYRMERYALLSNLRLEYSSSVRGASAASRDRGRQSRARRCRVPFCMIFDWNLVLILFKMSISHSLPTEFVLHRETSENVFQLPLNQGRCVPPVLISGAGASVRVVGAARAVCS
jgi:hypothetical protein